VKHDIRLEGFAYSLRPVELADAEFIVSVRTPERSRFMHDIDRTIQAQRDWIARHFERPGEYYFVIERKDTGSPEALSSLLTPDPESRSIQWGRFITRPGSRAGVEAAIFMHRAAFDVLGFDQIWGDVIADNQKMLAYCDSIFHDPIGRVQLSVDGKQVEGIRRGITREQWKAVESRLIEKARRIAEELRHSGVGS
jgi:RimJ/RimL family protein N-acetyltransferase